MFAHKMHMLFYICEELYYVHLVVMICELIFLHLIYLLCILVEHQRNEIENARLDYLNTKNNFSIVMNCVLHIITLRVLSISDECWGNQAVWQ